MLKPQQNINKFQQRTYIPKYLSILKRDHYEYNLNEINKSCKNISKITNEMCELLINLEKDITLFACKNLSKKLENLQKKKSPVPQPFISEYTPSENTTNTTKPIMPPPAPPPQPAPPPNSDTSFGIQNINENYNENYNDNDLYPELKNIIDKETLPPLPIENILDNNFSSKCEGKICTMYTNDFKPTGIYNQMKKKYLCDLCNTL